MFALLLILTVHLQPYGLPMLPGHHAHLHGDAWSWSSLFPKVRCQVSLEDGVVDPSWHICQAMIHSWEMSPIHRGGVPALVSPRPLAVADLPMNRPLPMLGPHGLPGS